MLLFGASAGEYIRERVISFVTSILVEGSGSPAHDDLASPRPGKRRRVIYGEPIPESNRTREGKPLDHVQVAVRSMKVNLVREIGCVHDQRVAFPVSN